MNGASNKQENPRQGAPSRGLEFDFCDVRAALVISGDIFLKLLLLFFDGVCVRATSRSFNEVSSWLTATVIFKKTSSTCDMFLNRYFCLQEMDLCVRAQFLLLYAILSCSCYYWLYWRYFPKAATSFFERCFFVIFVQISNFLFFSDNRVQTISTALSCYY